MNKIGFLPNIKKESSLSTTLDLMKYASSLGCEIFAPKEMRLLFANVPGINFCEDIYSNSDFAIVLGGDGTMLSAANRAVYTGTPLLGINLGNIGYLTDVDKDLAKDAIRRVLNSEYTIESRIMLEAAIGDSAPRLALNDITIYRGLSSRLIQCVVYINKEYMETFRADGMIIATPTGSTAYNLAAGGPILKPDAKMMVITPICPFTLSSRSTVISATDTISIHYDKNPTTIISFDGEGIILNEKTDCIHEKFNISVSVSQYITKIIKTNNHSFYEILRKKIGNPLNTR